MINRRRLIPSLFAVALLALCLPVLAAAQNGSYGRGDDSYRRDRNYGYNQRALRDSIKRVEDRSDDFSNHIDRALDHSRYDDSRREDRINDIAKEFHRAAETLKDRFNDGRALNRSSNEARRLLQLGSQINRIMQRNRFDARAESEWARIRQDLNVIAAGYGFNMSDFDGRYNDNRRRDDRRGNYPY